MLSIQIKFFKKMYVTVHTFLCLRFTLNQNYIFVIRSQATGGRPRKYQQTAAARRKARKKVEEACNVILQTPQEDLPNTTKLQKVATIVVKDMLKTKDVIHLPTKGQVRNF